MTNAIETLELRVAEALRRLRDLPGDLEAEDDPAFTIEQTNFLEKRLYELRTLLEGDDACQLSPDNTLWVHNLLAKHRRIAVIWSVEDVQGIRPDLTEEQAWEVLQQVSDIHDAEYGINWMTLETVARDLFGPAPETAKDRSQP